MKNLVFIIIVTFSLYTILEVPSSSADVSEKDSYEYTFPYERSGWSGDLKHSGAKCYQCHFSLLEKERAMGIRASYGRLNVIVFVRSSVSPAYLK